VKEQFKRWDYWLLGGLLIASAVNTFLPEKLFFAAVVLTLFIVIPFDRSVFYSKTGRLLLPFILLVVIGVIAGLRNIRVDLYRDVYLFSKNIFYFLAGIALSRFLRSFENFFRYFLPLAFLGALYHIARVGINFQSAGSLQELRMSSGVSNALEAIIAAIVIAAIASRKFRSQIGGISKLQTCMIVVIMVSFGLYLSRTMIVLVAVLAIFLADKVFVRRFFDRKNVRLLRLLVVFSSVIYIAYIGALFFPERSPVRTLAEKFRNIPEEVSWSREKNLQASRMEIQNNWRGYESYQGMLKFDDGKGLQKAFGYGFGARVDLGLIMKLAGEDYDTVPILHNEYVMLLVKSGIVGLLLYLVFLYMIGFTSITRFEINNDEIYYSYQMLSALSAVTILNTYIGFGLLDPTNGAIPIFMGLFWGNIQRHIYAIRRATAYQNAMAISKPVTELIK
jgi:O-antigen ligase